MPRPTSPICWNRTRGCRKLDRPARRRGEQSWQAGLVLRAGVRFCRARPNRADPGLGHGGGQRIAARAGCRCAAGDFWCWRGFPSGMEVPCQRVGRARAQEKFSDPMPMPGCNGQLRVCPTDCVPALRFNKKGLGRGLLNSRKDPAGQEAGCLGRRLGQRVPCSKPGG